MACDRAPALGLRALQPAPDRAQLKTRRAVAANLGHLRQALRARANSPHRAVERRRVGVGVEPSPAAVRKFRSQCASALIGLMPDQRPGSREFCEQTAELGAVASMIDRAPIISAAPLIRWT